MLRAASIDSNQGQTMMKIKFQRRQFLHLAAGAFALPAASRVARASPTSATPANHYALLRTIEAGFGLPALEHAGSPGTPLLSGLLQPGR